MDTLVIGQVPCEIHERHLWSWYKTVYLLWDRRLFNQHWFPYQWIVVFHLHTPEWFPRKERAHHGFMDCCKKCCNTSTKRNTWHGPPGMLKFHISFWVNWAKYHLSMVSWVWMFSWVYIEEPPFWTGNAGGTAILSWLPDVLIFPDAQHLCNFHSMPFFSLCSICRSNFQIMKTLNNA